MTTSEQPNNQCKTCGLPIRWVGTLAHGVWVHDHPDYDPFAAPHAPRPKGPA